MNFLSRHSGAVHACSGELLTEGQISCCVIPAQAGIQGVLSPIFMFHWTPPPAYNLPGQALKAPVKRSLLFIHYVIR